MRGPAPVGSRRATWPAPGIDTSRLPSGAHTASRGFDNLAQTDRLQSLGTSAFRGSSNGGSAMSSGTATVTSTRPDSEAGLVDVAVGAVGVDEHPASSSSPTRPSRNDLRGSKTGMHLPDQELGRFGRDDPVARRTP